jgi:hypothetical protein
MGLLTGKWRLSRAQARHRTRNRKTVRAEAKLIVTARAGNRPGVTADRSWAVTPSPWRRHPRRSACQKLVAQAALRRMIAVNNGIISASKPVPN